MQRLTTHGNPEDLATWFARTALLDATEVVFELSSWRVVTTRNAQQVQARVEPTARLPAMDELVHVLTMLPAQSLTELAIAKRDLAESEQLTDALRRFAGLARVELG